MENFEKSRFIKKQKNEKEGDNLNYIIEGFLDIKHNLLFNSKEDIK